MNRPKNKLRSKRQRRGRSPQGVPANGIHLSCFLQLSTFYLPPSTLGSGLEFRNAPIHPSGLRPCGGRMNCS
jgi:hypothetical protein